MKRLALLVCTLAVTSVLSAQRLPEGIAAPERYALTFAPDFTSNTFRGDETITLRVLKPTNVVTLNAAEIEFQEVTIAAAGASQKARVTPLAGKDMVELAVDTPLAPGPATVHIHYTGKLNDELRGLYLSKGKTRKYAITQFEATDARRAFPSFDEPAYKAVFEVTAIVDKGDTALSNGSIVADTPGPGPDKHTLRFSPSPKMSSYLVALAVGDWECVQADAEGIPIRVCSVPGSRDKMAFALDSAVACMKFYNRYFSVKYPYGKLDVLGAPDFSAGAMENTALIISRDVLIVADPKTTSTGQQKEIASVMAHEMAHQWFGDLVTMQWWDDIWLNEGFATWMENKPLEAWKPEWGFDISEIQETAGAMGADSQAITRPIHAVNAETPAQIDELFDEVAYGKAGSVLRMVEAYLGREAFRAGVNAYLAQHMYGNATAADFWTALARSSGKPVDRILPTFITQPGVPIVTLDARCSAGQTTVSLSQQRFFNDRSLFDKPGNEVWQIPVCLKMPVASGAQTEQHCEVVPARRASITLSGCPPWVFGNAGGVGYYRTGLSPEASHRIGAAAESSLTPGERIVFLADEWAQVRLGRHGVGDYLDLVADVKGDSSLYVQQTVLGRLGSIYDSLLSPSDQPAFQAWFRAQYRPRLASLGWEAKPNESPDARQLRPQVIGALGRIGRDPEVLAQARKLAGQYLEDPHALAPDVVGTVLYLAALNGDAALYERYLAQVKAAGDPQQYYRFFYDLAAFSDPALLQRTLDFALSASVRTQDSPGLIANVMGNPAGRQLAWDYIRHNWETVKQRTPPFGGQGIFVGSSGVFCDAGKRAEVQQFWAEHPVAQAERTLKQSIDQINMCIDLRDRQAGHLTEWLQQHPANSAGGQ